MRNFVHTIIAMVLFSGCGVSVLQMGTDIAYAKEQIKSGVDIHARYEDKETVLFWSAREGSLEMIDFYLSKGADINARNEWESTPLHWAVYANQLKAVKHLLSKGADLTAKDVAGDTALSLAKSEGFKDIADYLNGVVKTEYPAFVQAKQQQTLKSYKTFIKDHSQSVFVPLVEKLIAQRTQKLFNNPQEIKHIEEKLSALIAAKKFKNFMHYIQEDSKALVLAQSSEKFALLFVGPKNLTVGKLLAYKEDNYGELVLAAKVKGGKKPYKDFSFDEIKQLKQMGLSDVLVAAMLEVSIK